MIISSLLFSRNLVIKDNKSVKLSNGSNPWKHTAEVIAFPQYLSIKESMSISMFGVFAKKLFWHKVLPHLKRINC